MNTSLPQRLSGKTVVVTGGGSGIGQAIALRFASEGAEVIVFELRTEATEDTLDKIRVVGGCARAVVCDMSDTESVRSAFATVERLDVLVNNAGIAHVGNVLTTTPEDLDRLYAVNVRGVYHGLHFGVARMEAQGSGVILNMASIASKVGIADRFAYSMSKGAVLTMTLSVARDFVEKGIRCNCICPARVHTPFVDGFLDKNYPDKRDEMFAKLSAAQPMGRMGRPEEVASLAAFLCSDEAAFITGVAYDLDGGFTLLR
ncbi:MAG: SDR family oxidoreductase [Chthoniobacteraceae bacterium]|jgi:NAD(P)-dependent dehydrogenase (short-subunit alcohol dehydrogenase family)